MRAGFGRDPVAIGCGGTIGFVGPLAELFGGAPALLLGIEDPQTNAHAANESLHADDFRKLTASLAHLFENLGKLSPEEARGRKAEAGLAAPAPAEGVEETGLTLLPAGEPSPEPVATGPDAAEPSQEPAPSS